MQPALDSDSRWHLYRLLGDPTRLRLLALAAEEELGVGELAELLDEAQPNVSRHAAQLRQAGLFADRKQGNRTFVRLAGGARKDPVIIDALGAGRRLCVEDGSLARVAEVVQKREARAREFFAEPRSGEIGLAPELPSYLAAFGALLPARELAVDAGTGDGALLDLLAPLFHRVVAVDRSEAQLTRARQRVHARGYHNVELVLEQFDGRAVRAALGPGADLVVAARVLHHAPRPRPALFELARLARPGGRVLVIDYARHDDDAMREAQADVWLGFSPDELRGFAEDAGLAELALGEIPPYPRSGPDAHIGWLWVLGTRPEHDRNPQRRR